MLRRPFYELIYGTRLLVYVDIFDRTVHLLRTKWQINTKIQKCKYACPYDDIAFKKFNYFMRLTNCKPYQTQTKCSYNFCDILNI